MKRVLVTAAAVSALALGGCVGIANLDAPTSIAAEDVRPADAGTVVRCQEALGTLAVDDGREADWWETFAARTRIPTIEPLVRLIVEHSNCFVITARAPSHGRSSGGIAPPRSAGPPGSGPNTTGGRRVAADYLLRPAILVSSDDAGGTGTAARGVPGTTLGLAGAAMFTSSTSVTLSVLDVQAGAQIAASEGTSTASDFGAVLAGLGGRVGALAPYADTPAGQASVPAFVDAFNKMILAIRIHRAQRGRGGAGSGTGRRPG